MTTETQDAGTVTTAAGETQTTDQTTGAPVTQTTDATTTDTTTATTTSEVEYKFDAPEGVELNKDDLGKFTEIAKELKLPADAAKKLVEYISAKLAGAGAKGEPKAPAKPAPAAKPAKEAKPKAESKPKAPKEAEPAEKKPAAKPTSKPAASAQSSQNKGSGKNPWDD
jgi:ATP-dependent exoDNAse (exonuclease V) alpha subunit